MRRILPVLVLFLLSPFIAEVLFGATPVSNFKSLPPVMLAYGGGAVLIRELARRKGSGWWRIALLGAAYALIEEGLALQSMFHPALFNASAYGGRALGVNWVWSEWTVGYHILWSILLPILLTELLFPARRSEPWLGPAGLVMVGLLYALGTTAIGLFSHLFIVPGYQAPLVLTLGTALLAAGLVVLALIWPAAPEKVERMTGSRPAPSPWLAGLAALLASAAWFWLLGLPPVLRTGPLTLLPLLAELALAAGVLELIRQWSAASHAWTDLHRLALALGPLLVVMAVGFFGVTAGNRVNQVGQGIASAIALVLLVILAQRLRHHQGMLQAPLEAAPAHPRRHG